MKSLKQFIPPIIIFIVIVVFGRFAQQYVSQQAGEKLAIKTMVMAEQVGLRLHEFIGTRLTRLDILRESMENRIFDEAEFRSKALLLQYELSGFQAINWINNEGIIEWVTPRSINLPVDGVSLLDQGDPDAVKSFIEAQLYRIDASTSALDLIQGGVGFATYLPIVIDDNTRGFVNGVFRIDELISQCLGNTDRDFNYEVLLSGTVVFRRGESSNFEEPIALGRYNFTLMGKPWELQIVPTASEYSIDGSMQSLATAIVFIIALLVAIITQFRLNSRAELAQAYKIVEESEYKYRTIFDKSPASLLRFNQAGHFTDWNREAAALFGFEFPAKSKRNAFELNPFKPMIPSIEKALNGEVANYSGFLEVQGKIIEVDAMMETLVTGTDQIQGGIILLKDVTQQNQTIRAKDVMYEIANHTNTIKELPQLFKAIHHSLGRVLDTRNFYVNLYDEETNEFNYPYYEDEFDSAPPIPVKGEKGLSAYVLEKDASILFNKEEIYTLHREGKIDLIGTPAEQWLGSPLIVEGKPIGVMAVQTYSKETVFGEADMGMMNFVSDQIAVAIKINLEDAKLRLSEAKHRKLSEQLNDSNNIKMLLLDIITHDLKNPAAVIAGVADILSDKAEVSEEIKLITDSSDALLKVIENTTSLAKVTLGEKVQMKLIDISQIAEAVALEFQSGFRGREKTLVVEIEPGLSCEANPVIAEVFRNYLSNALKYAPKGEVVQFKLHDTGAEIELLVIDKGTNIPRDEQESIFQRTVQLEKEEAQGRGLGLAIAKRVAEVHGATVGVYEHEPQGNAFFMRIPKTVEQKSDSDESVGGLNAV